MPSIRCEEMRYDESRGPSGLDDQSDSAVIEFIGDGNTTVSTPTSSTIVFGPAPRAMNVLVRSFRGQAYVTTAPVATAANSVLIDIDGEAPLKLNKGDSIAAIAASVS